VTKKVSPVNLKFFAQRMKKLPTDKELKPHQYSKIINIFFISPGCHSGRNFFRASTVFDMKKDFSEMTECF
jgi:hypothetical protein